MNVIFSDRITETGKDIELLRQASDFLEKATGPAAPKVNVVWDLKKDNGHLLYTVRISDWAATAETEFAPDELRVLNPDLRFRLTWLWGEVLQKRSHKQLAKLQEDASES